jgi:hypothetical protein
MHNMDDGWFYEDKGERKRAASMQELVSLIETGALDRRSLVWKEGFAEWQHLGDTELRQHLNTQTPPPLTGQHVNNTLVWVLAFAPLIGYTLEWALAFAIHESDYRAERAMAEGGYWFITLGLNILLGVLDEKRLQKAGHNTSHFRGWVWLVPVYMFQRAKHLQQNLAYFVVWLVCFALILIA